MFSQEDFQKQCLSRLGLCGVAFFDEDATNEALAGAYKHYVPGGCRVSVKSVHVVRCVQALRAGCRCI